MRTIEYKERLDGRLLRVEFELGEPGTEYRFIESYLAERVRMQEEEPDKLMGFGSNCRGDCPFYCNGRCSK